MYIFCEDIQLKKIENQLLLAAWLNHYLDLVVYQRGGLMDKTLGLSVIRGSTQRFLNEGQVNLLGPRDIQGGHGHKIEFWVAMGD